MSELSDVVVLGIDKKDKYRLVWANGLVGLLHSSWKNHNQSEFSSRFSKVDSAVGKIWMNLMRQSFNSLNLGGYVFFTIQTIGN